MSKARTELKQSKVGYKVEQAPSLQCYASKCRCYSGSASLLCNVHAVQLDARLHYLEKTNEYREYSCCAVSFLFCDSDVSCESAFIIVYDDQPIEMRTSKEKEFLLPAEYKIPPILESQRKDILDQMEDKRAIQARIVSKRGNCINPLCDMKAYNSHSNSYCLDCTEHKNQVQNHDGICSWLVSHGDGDEIIESWESIPISKIEHKLSLHKKKKGSSLMCHLHLIIDATLPDREYI
jgi:hypothetical protein